MIAEILGQASLGVLMPSESDYPFTPFVWGQQGSVALTPTKLLELSGNPSDLEVTSMDLRAFLHRVAEPQAWHDEMQRHLAPQFRALIAALEANLSNIAVYRVGVVQVQVYIVGRSGDDLAGLQTTLIET